MLPGSRGSPLRENTGDSAARRPAARGGRGSAAGRCRSAEATPRARQTALRPEDLKRSLCILYACFPFVGSDMRFLDLLPELRSSRPSGQGLRSNDVFGEAAHLLQALRVAARDE